MFAALVAMPVAMTAPLLQVPLSHVRRSALYERRTRSLAFFLAGHLCAWALTVTVLMAVAFGLRLLVSSAFAATGLVLAAALIWHGAPFKPIARNRSHVRLPLPRLWRAGRRGCNALWRPVRRLVRRLVLAIDARADDGRRRASPMTVAAAALMLFERTARPIGAVPRWRWIGAGVSVGASVVTGLLFRRSDPWTLSAPLSAPQHGAGAADGLDRVAKSSRFAAGLSGQADAVERPPAAAAQNGAETNGFMSPITLA